MARTAEQVMQEIGTWDDPVTELQKRGIKGERDNCELCPMAQYLIREIDPAEVGKVSVDNSHTDFWYPNEIDSTFSFRIDNPPKMAEFISLFDDGEVPELDVNPDTEWDEDTCECCR